MNNIFVLKLMEILPDGDFYTMSEQVYPEKKPSQQELNELISELKPARWELITLVGDNGLPSINAQDVEELEIDIDDNNITFVGRYTCSASSESLLLEGQLNGEGFMASAILSYEKEDEGWSVVGCDNEQQEELVYKIYNEFYSAVHSPVFDMLMATYYKVQEDLKK